MTNKPYLSIHAICQSLAELFKASGEMRPTPTDTRCAVNEALDRASREGYRVKFGYSQPAAHRRIRRALGT